MHPAIIIGIFRSLIVDVAMGQIPRSTERIYSYYKNGFRYAEGICSPIKQAYQVTNPVKIMTNAVRS